MGSQESTTIQVDCPFQADGTLTPAFCGNAGPSERRWRTYTVDALMVLVKNCGLHFTSPIALYQAQAQTGEQVLRGLQRIGVPFVDLLSSITGGNLLHFVAHEPWSYSAAERRGTERLIDLLVEWGVDPTVRDNAGQRPEDINGFFSAQLRRHRVAREQAAPQMTLF